MDQMPHENKADSTTNKMGDTMQMGQDKAHDTATGMAGATHDHANQAGDMAGKKWEEGKQGASETKDQGGNMLTKAGDKMGETWNSAKDTVTGNK